MNRDIVILTCGGIGDLIVCTPALRALKESCPDRRLIVYCVRKDHTEVLQHNPYIDSVRHLQPSKMWRYPYHLYAYLFDKERIKYYELFFQHIPPSLVYTNKSIKDIVYEIFTDFSIGVRYTKTQLFFTREEEQKAIASLSPYRDVIVMHVNSRCSKNHEWPMDRWNALVAALPEYTFLQLGAKDEPLVEGVLDWRGRTTLREGLCLLKYASSFVGVDSSLSHATNAFDLPGVVLFGDSTPVYWGHDNNINIYKDLSCAPCYYYLWGDPCPYGHPCMKSISVEEVRTALIRQMEKNKNPAVPIPVPADQEFANS